MSPVFFIILAVKPYLLLSAPSNHISTITHLQTLKNSFRWYNIPGRTSRCTKYARKYSHRVLLSWRSPQLDKTRYVWVSKVFKVDVEFEIVPILFYLSASETFTASQHNFRNSFEVPWVPLLESYFLICTPRHLQSLSLPMCPSYRQKSSSISVEALENMNSTHWLSREFQSVARHQ